MDALSFIIGFCLGCISLRFADKRKAKKALKKEENTCE